MAVNDLATSPWHYDSALDGPGIHFDLFFDAGPVTHTLRSLSVVCDAGSPYHHINIRHPGGTEWVSPLIPTGSATFTQAQINSTGFTTLEDIDSLTASH
jgi:hypothetical protein